MTTQIFTIGHSSHAPDRFIVLLRGVGIETVVDIRSQPHSRFAPQFDKRNLRDVLSAHGVQYLWMGRELGGRPDGPGLYDEGGHVRYDRLAETAGFLRGIDRLLVGVEKFCVAILCSEEDPTDCHRRLLVGRVLADRGVEVEHLRGDGRRVTEAEISEAEREKHPERYQGSLFGSEDEAWRSIRSVSGNTARRNSLKP
jgi:uncharacterized protein (DUF488 family)